MLFVIMKKLLLVFGSLFLFLVASQLPAYAQDKDGFMPEPGVLPEDFDYKTAYVDENGWLLYYPTTDKDKDLVIPSQINGKEVKGLAIGFIDGDFLGNTLESIDIPGSVIKVEYVSLFMASKLKKITLHEGTKALGQQCFGMAGELTEIILPKSIEYLGGQVFVGCAKLQKVYVGPKVKNISTVFMDTPKLTDITIDPENPYLKFRDNAVFSSDGKVLQWFPQTQKIKEYTTPAGCKKIATASFAHSPLEKVILSKDVRDVGYLSFVYSTSLKYVDIQSPERVNFDKGAFAQTFLDIMIVRSLDPPTFQPTSFGGTSEDDLGQKTCTLYVPDEAWDEYNNSDLPKYFKDMKKISELPAAGVDDVVAPVSLKVVNKTLYYEMAKGEPIQIYNLSGELIYTETADNAIGSIDLSHVVNGNGVYVIQAAKKAIKVVL